MLDFLVAQPRTMNMESVSMVVIEHPEPKLCPKCGMTMTVGVTQIQGMALGTFQVEPRQKVIPFGKLPTNIKN